MSLKGILGELNGRNLKLLGENIKKYGFRDTVQKCRKAVIKTVPKPQENIRNLVRFYTSGGLEEGKYSYPSSDEPLVSIIIPVYNHLKMTYDCIRSLIDSDLNVATEVIIADDCSSDNYTEFQRYISGVKVVRTLNNCGFTRNCNHAAKSAKGKYLFFLNNDTIVTKNWLSPLIDIVESDDQVGLVGSKLLFPDGTLQEAGGILWKDGSAWNYGRDENANDPEFCYVHDVDYVSGAAILVRRSIFEQLNGFDERYAPAYCEDSDLAFEIRRLGCRTVYQPFSIIVHFEGMSNGKRVDTGLKKYQVINQNKFYEKWKDVLEKEHFDKGTNLFKARDRSINKTTILFIDDKVPRYDDNAGHRTVYDYMKTLSEMDYNVKLMPNEFQFDDKYVTTYQKMGIEVLYGEYYWTNWKKWLMENGKYFDHVMLFRPEMAKKYLSILKECVSAKIHYNVADLHYLRLMKEYQITGNEAYLKESIALKAQELEYIRKSDYAITVSEDERQIIDAETGNGKARVFPIFCFDNVDSGTRDYVSAKDLMFVGGFSHRPNIDAVIWFVNEVLPKIRVKIPDVKFHVIGSQAPPEVISMASDSVFIEGRVSDEVLAQFYDTCAVCVIPLRYGAGVKGKTVEALQKKIPIVTTSIGIEGLPDIWDYLASYDDAEGFANEVIRLLEDRKTASQESMAHTEYIRKYYSRESMKSLFIENFGEPKHN